MTYDLLVVGGGINGAAVARDAAGRGLSVLLVEQDDLASGTSSISSKLVHGGLRYLEQGRLGLVRESLREREVLLAAAPHLVRPLQFVLPHAPWQRPAWMLRVGLFLYDRLGGRRSLSASHGVTFGEGGDRAAGLGQGLASEFTRGFTYADCWADDARLVVANALDAAAHGASIRTRTALLAAERQGGAWSATLESAAGRESVQARALVNAAGPWVKRVLDVTGGGRAASRLVKGSHIVVPRLHEGDHALILQHEDGRVVFVLPYERHYSLVGTTDVPIAVADMPAPGQPMQISPAEVEYLCAVTGRFLERGPKATDVVWSYAGVRPLYDDGKANPSAVTREAVLELDAPGGAAPLLSIFGGKLTTHRHLAEGVLRRLASFVGGSEAWTQTARLPGGDGVTPAVLPDLPADWLDTVGLRYGSRAGLVLGDARRAADLGERFVSARGETVLCEREVAYLAEHEWAHTADDVLWRRTKAGLHLDAAGRQAVAACLARLRPAGPP